MYVFMHSIDFKLTKEYDIITDAIMSILRKYIAKIASKHVSLYDWVVLEGWK